MWPPTDGRPGGGMATCGNRFKRVRHSAITESAGSMLRTQLCTPLLFPSCLGHRRRTDRTDENFACCRFPGPPVTISWAFVPAVRTEESILLRCGTRLRWVVGGRWWHAIYSRRYLHIRLTLATKLYQLMTMIGSLLHSLAYIRRLLHGLKLATVSHQICGKS